MTATVKGVGVSRGIAIGEAYVYRREQADVSQRFIRKSQHEKEIARFKKALKQAGKQLRDIKDQIAQNTPVDILAFIDTHLLMLEDPAFRDGTIQNIRTLSCNAEWALHKQGERLLQVFDDMDDPYLKTRRDDVLYVLQRIQNCLTNTPETQLDTSKLAKHIIVADDLTPADTILIGHNNVAGFITQYGTPLSHTAILASNLGIPAIVGAPDVCQQIKTGDMLILDGYDGVVHINPDDASLAHFRSLIRSESKRRAELKKLKGQPCVTLDKKPITLQANIDSPADIKQINKYDTTGVGLFRTEMLFIDQNQWPSEQQQFKFYKSALSKLKGMPLTIRTSDLGADKELQDTVDHGPMAHNPAMGLRAIRRCLKEPDLLTPQIRAILRASAFGPVLMMIPMLTNIEELDEVLQHVEQCKQQLRDSKVAFDENLPVGAMIEVPAAALAADAFASKLDFLSIGTNDLIQYCLALDRVDDEVNHLFNPLHPAVLQLIKMVIDAGKFAGIPVSLCGEMASDPKYTRLLLGMGLTYFSVQPNALLEIKHIINNSKINSLRPRVRKILQLYRADEIEQQVRKLND